MGATRLGDVADQVKKFWSPLFMDELKETTLLPSLVNKDYDGQIMREGDTVYVSQLNRPNAERKQTGAGSDSFSSQKMSTSRISIQANQRITASYEVEDLVDIQSQLNQANPAIRRALLEAVEIELNNYLYSLVSPSTSAPDHSVDSVSDLNKAAMVANRILAGQAKWRQDGGWWALLDPSYHGDVLSDNTLSSREYAPEDAPVVGGQLAQKRFGFNILEDTSAGLLSLSPAAAGADCGLFFHPDFMHLVMQKEPTFKVSDLHSNKQHGYLISVDIILGASLGIDGNIKHIVNYNS